jgi:hypothetical protein
MNRSIRLLGRWLAALGFGLASVIGIAPAQAQELCGGTTYPFPYTDVSGVGTAFCPGIMEAYVTGVSKGTTPTTFSPNETVTRVQMTTFLQRSLDQGLMRTSRRAALNQWWTANANAMQTITLDGLPEGCAADGENIWVSTLEAGHVAQIQASTGLDLNHWTGATNPGPLVVAAGKIFVLDGTVPGVLYAIDPTQPAGTLPVASSNLGDNPNSIAFDGTNVWTANGGGSVSIISAQSPYTVTTVSTGFVDLIGILYDGAHIWVTDGTANTLLKLDSSGAIIQTVNVGKLPQFPVFDGTNIWVPNRTDSSISVVQASTGNVVATIDSDGENLLAFPIAASFDGERVLVTNLFNSTVTVFKAADLSVMANVAVGDVSVFFACSDGINFWLPTGAGLLRF